MKKLSTYLVVMFMIMYWIFRVIVVLMAQLGKRIYSSTTKYEL